jgi:hypothetical protein
MTGAPERSRFQECEFVDIQASDCHVGHAVFDRCTFEDILSEDTTTLHEAEFLECTFRGMVRYLNFGAVPYAASPFHSQTRQRQAIENLASRPFGIDVSLATLEECSVVGDEFTRKLRFRREQGFLVRGERLDLILEPELRDTQDLDFAECLTTPVANGVSQNVHFCAIPTRARHRRDYYVARVRELGVELLEDPMC